MGYNSNLNEMKKNKSTESIKTNTKRYGLPVGSKAKLASDNTIITEKTVKHINKSVSEKAVAVKSVKKTPVQNKEPVKVNAKSESNVAVRQSKGEALVSDVAGDGAVTLREPVAKRIISVLSPEETKHTVSVSGGEAVKRKAPLFTIFTIVFVCVLFMFIIIDYVEIFENQSLINSLKSEMEASKNEEKQLNTSLEQKYDIVALGEIAKEKYGMVGSENQKEVYVDISEDDEATRHEPVSEDYGAIATVMDALGESAKAWIEIFGN